MDFIFEVFNLQQANPTITEFKELNFSFSQASNYKEDMDLHMHSRIHICIHMSYDYIPLFSILKIGTLGSSKTLLFQASAQTAYLPR